MANPKFKANVTAGEVNKSDAIRKQLAANPTAKSKEIVAALAAKGIKVSENLVYLVKSKAKAKTRRQKRAQAGEQSRQAGITNPVQAVRLVCDVAGQVGGVKTLKQLVDLLAG
jgi:hypothetical protein